MRKTLVVVLSMLFVMGLVGSAFAIHADIPSETQAAVAKGTTQVTLGGEIRVRGEFKQNTSDFDKDKADHSSAYDERVRLGIEAKVSPNTTGYVQVESNSASDTTDTYTWGDTTTFGTGAKGMYPAGNSKRGDLRILQAWINHSGSGLLGIPAGVKVGHMPLALGNGLFFDHTKFGDDALVFYMDPVKELHIGLLNAKFTEGTATKPDDSDAYVLLGVYKPNKGTSISADVTYINDQAATTKGLHFWNFGLRGSTDISGFGIKADVEMNAGKAKVDSGTDTKYRGYALMAGVSYKLDPVKLSLDYAYGSGDDDATDNKAKSFVNSLGVDQHYTYVYEYRTVNAANQASGGLTNTWYLKLGANADVAKDLNADLGVYILRAVKKNNMAAVYGFANDTDSKSIGTEVDAKVTYKIDKNLQYWVEGGYLFAGNFWRVKTGTAKDPDDAYAVRHGIQLNF